MAHLKRNYAILLGSGFEMTDTFSFSSSSYSIYCIFFSFATLVLARALAARVIRAVVLLQRSSSLEARAPAKNEVGSLLMRQTSNQMKKRNKKKRERVGLAGCFDGR